MLARIETAYLAILRVVVLVVATVALLVAVGAAIMAVPGLVRQAGLASGPAAAGGDLGDYIRDKKATIAARTDATDDAASAPTPAILNADLDASAATLQTYTKGQGSMTIPQWRDEIGTTAAKAIAADNLLAYFRDVRALTDQLARSTGKRLTNDQVRELLAWNLEKFNADAAVKAGEAAQVKVRSLATLYVAGIAFTFFLLVVFTFLFVKVERSLRLVRTVQMGALDA